MDKNPSETHALFLNKINTWLFILLLCMVAGFFTWSENVAITRLIKVVGRMGVLIGVIGVYWAIIKKGAIDTQVWKNVFSPGLYMAYLGLGFISFLWSTNVGYSALQWFMIFQSMVFAFFFIKSIKLLDTYFPGSQIKFYHLLGNATFVLISIFVVGMYVSPDSFYRLTHGGEEARLGGYIMNPNELGMLAGVGVACLVFDIYRSHRIAWTLSKIAILLFALYATGSRSSLIGVLLIIFFHIILSDKKQLKLLVITAMMIISPIAIWKVVLKDGDSTRIEEIMSMTGRLPFWTALINEGLPREPLLGFGFMRIDYKEYFQSTHTYPGKMTHNTFMQVLMNLGFVGLTIVLFQLYFTIKGILHEDKENKLMLLSFMIPIMINSFTEFGIFGESNYGILFYQLIIFSIAFQNRKHLTTAEKMVIKRNF